MMKIKWTDKISNEELPQRIKVKELCLYNSVKKQKMAFVGHVLRGSSGKDLLDVLEGNGLRAYSSKPAAAACGGRE